MAIHLEFTPGTIRVTDVDTGADLSLVHLRQITIANPDDLTHSVENLPGQLFVVAKEHSVTVRTADGKTSERWDIRNIDDGTTYPTTADLIDAIQTALDNLSGGGGSPSGPAGGVLDGTYPNPDFASMAGRTLIGVAGAVLGEPAAITAPAVIGGQPRTLWLNGALGVVTEALAGTDLPIGIYLNDVLQFGNATHTLALRIYTDTVTTGEVAGAITGVTTLIAAWASPAPDNGDANVSVSCMNEATTNANYLFRCRQGDATATADGTPVTIFILGIA